MTLHTVGAGFDERRNTSRVFAPAPDALPKALGALRAYRHEYPKHAEWVLAGAPTLTEAEHLEQFGMVYKRGELT